MFYTFTLLPSNPPDASYAASGSDGNTWLFSVNGNLLVYLDDVWSKFSGLDNNLINLAVRELKNIWVLHNPSGAVNVPSNFNGVGWMHQNLPPGATAKCLSVGFDGVAYCLDSIGDIWRFSAGWSRFQGPASGTRFVQISSGSSGPGGTFLVAIDDSAREWQYNDSSGWIQMPNVTQGFGKYIAAGPNQSVYVVDTSNEQIWRWRTGDSNWVLLNTQGSFVTISVDGEGRVLAVDTSNKVFQCLLGGELTGLTGFRGSDWDNEAEALYAVKNDGTGDKIYKSMDRGETFAPVLTYSPLPRAEPDGAGIYGYALPLMIPKTVAGEAEAMLVSPISHGESPTLYVCSDISQTPLNFIDVPLPDAPKGGTAGVFNGFTEDADGNVYVGLYSIGTSANAAILYRSPRSTGYTQWDQVTKWNARHIHTVKVNPFNGYLYVVLGEPNENGDATHISSDAGKVFRSKDNGESWACVTDKYTSVPVVPGVRGLYFSTVGFVGNRVLLGEDTDHKKARIFYFDDDGRDGDDAKMPLPFPLQLTYTAVNDGEFFLGTVEMDKRTYFATQYLGSLSSRTVTSTRCVSTTDGIGWRLEQDCPTSGPIDQNFGVLTFHPERGGRIIYSLSSKRAFFIDRG